MENLGSKSEWDTKQIGAEVMTRLLGKGIVCPDCHQICNDVLVERFQHKIYHIDLSQRKLTTTSTEWETNDYALHCPHCDSLNLDMEVRNLNLDMVG